MLEGGGSGATLIRFVGENPQPWDKTGGVVEEARKFSEETKAAGREKTWGETGRLRWMLGSGWLRLDLEPGIEVRDGRFSNLTEDTLPLKMWISCRMGPWVEKPNQKGLAMWGHSTPPD
jgi:hypothetical protein